jgi:hypothetical protein
LGLLGAGLLSEQHGREAKSEKAAKAQTDYIQAVKPAKPRQIQILSTPRLQ